jgi:hypothetical protein
VREGVQRSTFNVQRSTFTVWRSPFTVWRIGSLEGTCESGESEYEDEFEFEDDWGARMIGEGRDPAEQRTANGERLNRGTSPGAL